MPTPSNNTSTENSACKTVGKTAELLTGGVVSAGIAIGMIEALPLEGVALLAAPSLARLMTISTVGQTVAPVVRVITQPVGKAVERACLVVDDDLHHPIDNIATPALTGIAQGLGDLGNTILHPVDTLSEIGSLAWDIVTMAAVAGGPESEACREVLEAYQKSLLKTEHRYSNAHRRMQERFEHLGAFGRAFTEANHPEKVQMAARFLTTIYLPGSAVKVARGIENLEKLGKFNPAVYRQRSRIPRLKDFMQDYRWYLDNFFDFSEFNSHYAPHLWSSIDDIRRHSSFSLGAENTYAYVILRNGEFRAIDERFGGHFSITRGQPILMGGDLVAKNGRIIKVDNRTGDYVPYLEPKVMKHVLGKLGVSEIHVPGVIQETYSKASSIRSRMRRSNDLQFSNPHPAALFHSALLLSRELHGNARHHPGENLQESTKCAVTSRNKDAFRQACEPDMSNVPSKTFTHNKRKPMPTQRLQVSAAASSSMQSRVTQQHVIKHPDSARQTAADAVDTSTQAHQHGSVDPNHARFMAKIGVLQRQAEVVCASHAEETSLVQLAPHFQTLFTLSKDALTIANSFGNNHSLVTQIGGAVAGLERITSGAMMLSNASQVATGTASAASALGAMGPAMSAMTAVAPYIAVAAGVAMLASSFIKHKPRGEQSPMHALMVALQQLGNMIQQVLINQEKIYDTLQVALHRIDKLEDLIKHQHGETQAGISFISRYPLETATLAIQRYIKGNSPVILSPEAIGGHLTTLADWATQHLGSRSMNASSSGPTSPELSVGILAQNMQSPFIMIGFVLGQLRALLGGHRIPDEYFSLPALEFFIPTVQLYLEGMTKAKLPSDDASASICKKLEKITETYNKLIQFFKDHSEIWIALFDQYQYQRNRVGRALSAVSIPNTDAPLEKLVANDMKRLQLMEALDQMEEKRLLLCILLNYTEGDLDSDLGKRIEALTSKAQILAIKGSELFNNRSKYYSSIAENNRDGLELALLSGVDLNQRYAAESRWYNSPGNAINRISHLRYSQQSNQVAVDLTHKLLSHNSETEKITLNISASKPAAGFDTWWHTNLPMRIFLNNSRYELPLLLIAAGFDGPWGFDSLANLPWWVANGAEQAAETMMIISSTLGDGGTLNRHKLRTAYCYYQAFTNGDLMAVDRLLASGNGVDPHCVLWLVALLGNWAALENLRLSAIVNLSNALGNFDFIYQPQYVYTECSASALFTTQLYGGKVNRTLTSRYTPLMVAAELGRENVIIKLIELIRKDSLEEMNGINNTLPSGRSAATLAFEKGDYKIARYLNEKGAPLSAAHLAELDKKAIPKNIVLVIEERPEIIALKSINRKTTTQHETMLEHLKTSISQSAALFADILPRSMVTTDHAASTRESEAAQCQHGVEYAKALGLSIICAQLHKKELHTVANFLLPQSNDEYFEIKSALTPAETSGFFSELSRQSNEAITRLTETEDTPSTLTLKELKVAVNFLSRFSAEQTTKSLASSCVSNILLQDTEHPQSAVRTFGVFSNADKTQMSQSSASAAAARPGLW